jgi:beta propeller repeat protein
VTTTQPNPSDGQRDATTTQHTSTNTNGQSDGVGSTAATNTPPAQTNATSTNIKASGTSLSTASTSEKTTDNTTMDVGTTTAPETASTTPSSEHVRATVVNDTNRYQFSKDQCADVGDGSYYCNVKQITTPTLDQDGVFVENDTDGDKEIYLQVNGVRKQITHNLTDDDAPYYDEVSNTIVWERLLSGRYQIFEYNLNTSNEKQLTDDNYNNMQPSRYGTNTVWQSWVDNNWEIVLDQNGKRVQLTHNNTHDISPRINGNYVIWQSFEGNHWRVKVYDIKTGMTETISDSNGGSVQNPRFVLVYDTKFANGDVETRGYDLRNKETVPLSSTPAPVPRNIPNPEPTNQKSTLPETTMKTKLKSSGGLSSDGNGDGSTGGTDGNNLATSTTDVVVSPFVSDAEATTTLQKEGTSDVVISPRASSTAATSTFSTDTEKQITDIVVAPYQVASSTPLTTNSAPKSTHATTT